MDWAQEKQDCYSRDRYRERLDERKVALDHRKAFPEWLKVVAVLLPSSLSYLNAFSLAPSPLLLFSLPTACTLTPLPPTSS